MNFLIFTAMSDLQETGDAFTSLVEDTNYLLSDTPWQSISASIFFTSSFSVFISNILSFKNVSI